MGLHQIKKGLDLPLANPPVLRIDEAVSPQCVAVVARDYVGMRATFFVKAGDSVKRGQTLFEDKKNPGVLLTSPGAGTVAAIHRGDRRALLSVVIELSGGERSGSPGDEDFQSFAHYSGKDPDLYSPEEIRALLIESGLWTALRTRPFSRVPAVNATPQAIFVTATDSHPHAPPMDSVAEGRDSELNAGLRALSRLTTGKVYFCKAAGSTIKPSTRDGIVVEEFAGPHPSGTAGMHIHLLEPVSRYKTVWHLGLQDVIAMGALLQTGRLDVRRIVSLAGPGVLRPRLLRTRLGAAVDDLVRGELAEGEMRVISGSVLSGRSVAGAVHGFLGRYHQQISVIAEGREKEFLGWLVPGMEKYSVVRSFLSCLIPGKRFSFTTTTNGSERAMVPIGSYERVMPMDVLPTFLLRSLIVNDVERAEQLGCLELDEEDLALCTFVCPGKYEYGPILRRNLDIIESEG